MVRDRAWAAAGAAVLGFSFPVLWCFLYHIAEDKEGYWVTPCWVLALPVSVGCTRLLGWAESVGAPRPFIAGQQGTSEATPANGGCSSSSSKIKTKAKGQNNSKMASSTMLAVLAAACAVLSPASFAIYHNRHSCDRSDDTRAASLVKDVVQPLESGVSFLSPSLTCTPMRARTYIHVCLCTRVRAYVLYVCCLSLSFSLASLLIVLRVPTHTLPPIISRHLTCAHAQALLLNMEWQFYSPWWALHHLEGLRPDLLVIDVNLVRD